MSAIAINVILDLANVTGGTLINSLAMPPKESGQITALLREIRRGNKEAESDLIPLVYEELRRLARGYLRRERAGHTLQTTALVHEAYMRLADASGAEVSDRTHFFALSAALMRRILVDSARSRLAQKRGSGLGRSLDGIAEPAEMPSWERILDVHQALNRLSEKDPRSARVVELRFFSGLEIEEIAEVLGVSSRTVKRDWQFAQTWLYSQIAAAPKSDDLGLMSLLAEKSRFKK
jgi:RNA polymerase sigma factor (TIGR02999 family)